MTLAQTITIAASRAQQHFESNLSALDAAQPRLRTWIVDQVLCVEWVAARDGYLSALDESGQWLAGCSLPLRAAQAMLARLELRGSVACFLAPAHAAQVRAALDRLRPEQAVVAIVPEMRDLACMLHCEDFSADLRGHRLWFAAGPAWDAGLSQIFEEHPGLATPTQFIRLPDADASVADEMISASQQIFAQVGAARSASIQITRQSFRSARPASERPRLCVVAPSRFRLWNDLGSSMLGIFGQQRDIEIDHFDCDDPARSSPLALIQAAGSCDAIFTANTGRSDLPGIVGESTPWITWVTSSRLPSSALAGIDDHLIVTDESTRRAAVKSGWPEARVHVGTWPQARPFRGGTPTPKPSLTLVCDTHPLDTPGDLNEYSSHSLLWEAIRNELLRDPLAIEDPDAFLNDRMRQLGAADDAFPRARFIEKLILPACQRGLARLLLQNKIPLKLFGNGWNLLPEFKAHACGPIHSREQFLDALDQGAGLVHVWPAGRGHPIDTLEGVRVVRRTGRDRQGFIRDARAALEGRSTPQSCRVPRLDVGLIRQILASAGR